MHKKMKQTLQELFEQAQKSTNKDWRDILQLRQLDVQCA